MDISGTLHPEIPKPDFFEYITISDDSVAVVAHPPAAPFTRIKEEIITENIVNNNNNTLESKETNNNHLMMNALDMAPYDHDLWPAEDPNIMEELNTWAAETSQGAVKTDNTDGAIYTLTVLNGSDQPVWYKHEPKEEKPAHSSLDFDSLFNIMPANFSNNFSQEVKPDYHFEDSGYVEKKEEPCSNPVTEIVLANSGNFNNNNEWKQENNNEVDSLLRNALQGKSFVRYNGIKTEKVDAKKTEEDKMMSIETPLMYDSSTIVDSDNPSSAHSTDDFFLTHLDVSYPEDYEKLKRIETEVAEYCLERSYLQPGSQLSVEPILNIATSTKPSKKYTKRSKSQLSAPGSSSGVRKERSLHYCNICNKGFKDKYSVNVHIRTHTGEKPFSCSLCGKSFRQKAHLAKHYQTHMAQAKNGVTTSQKSTKNLIPTS